MEEKNKESMSYEEIAEFRQIMNEELIKYTKRIKNLRQVLVSLIVFLLIVFDFLRFNLWGIVTYVAIAMGVIITIFFINKYKDAAVFLKAGLEMPPESY